MSTRLNVILSDDLNTALNVAACSSESNKSEILRKALQLYLAALKGNRDGLSVGLIDPSTKEVKTKIIGL